jgi:hypothetical protein
MTGRISTRPYTTRCTTCFLQKSKLSKTPLHSLKLPMWMFGWVAHESFQRFPNVLTSAEIHRRLDISYKSALNLKRRFQVFCSDQQEPLKALFRDYLEDTHYELPPSRKTDLTELLKSKRQPVNIDTLALFSASQRTNKGRKRSKHGGLTASIYMNASLGGRQIGSLYQTIAVKNGPVFLQSVPNQKMDSLLPQLEEHIPTRSPVFSDEGYKWYYNPNHRMVKHSQKSKDKRYRLAKDRWSKNGVHCQTAEGVQGLFKTAMRNYRYFRPKYSQLYANEFSFLKNAGFFGLQKLGSVSVSSYRTKKDCVDSPYGISATQSYLFHPQNYSPPEIKESIPTKNSETAFGDKIHQKQFERLRLEMNRSNEFFRQLNLNWRLYKEREYSIISEKLWRAIMEYKTEWVDINEVISEQDIDRKKALRIVQLWCALRVVELVDYTGYGGLNIVRFKVKPKLNRLPTLLYIQGKLHRHSVLSLFRKHRTVPTRKKRNRRRFK